MTEQKEGNPSRRKNLHGKWMERDDDEDKGYWKLLKGARPISQRVVRDNRITEQRYVSR